MLAAKKKCKPSSFCQHWLSVIKEWLSLLALSLQLSYYCFGKITKHPTDLGNIRMV